jgi:CxxC motif-containing protein (DUF1111 family)/subtilisin-like proprotein convertase family protein
MKHAALFATAVLSLSVRTSQAQVEVQPRAGEPLQGLSPLERMLFDRGRRAFANPLTKAQGLGPAFNRENCTACHESDTLAGTTTVLRFASDANGAFDPLTRLGGPVMQADGISSACKEFGGLEANLPAEANIRTRRVTPPVAGSGLIEAIPAEQISALEDPSDQNGDGVSGRVHMVTRLEDDGDQRGLFVGRFGWKSQLATVLSFSSDAALHEMGLTNEYLSEETAPEGDFVKLEACDEVEEVEDIPDEIGQTFIQSVTHFQRLLAAPPQSPRRGMRGEALFHTVGCTKCHTPEFTTSNSPELEPSVRGKTIRPYSDFLLHDMGSLGDRMVDGDATGSEMKTPPLWGLRHRPALLHDGSVTDADFATRVTRAVQQHFGEAAASKDLFLARPETDRAAIIAFLASLGRPEFDANDDNAVDFRDFAIVLQHVKDADVSPDAPWAVADLNSNRRIDADEVRQLRTLAKMPVDCNANGIEDWEEIADGTSSDFNSNGKPDECDSGKCFARSIRVTAPGNSIPDLFNGRPGRLELTKVIEGISGTIRGIRVGIDMEHTWLLDLTVTLKCGPASATLIAPALPCLNDHLNSSDLSGIYRFEDDTWDGSEPPQVCSKTFQIDRGPAVTDPEKRFLIAPGTYQPFNDFSQFIGAPVEGSYVLTIEDRRSPDVGRVNSWWIEIIYDPDFQASDDCNGNRRRDCDDIRLNPALDCDSNGQIDQCQLNANTDRWPPANGGVPAGNGVLDTCDIDRGSVSDRDFNGVPDPLDPDRDGDGFPDPVDECPDNAFRVLAGDCGCGDQAADDDSDGFPNCEDACPDNPAIAVKEQIGPCGCDGPAGANPPDSDGDGTPDCIDGCPNNASKTSPGLCGCDKSDADTDRDGVPDCNDGCPNDALKTAPGACGCGTPDIDSDGDGVANCNDECPNNPLKTTRGVCNTCEGSDADSDGDGAPDCIDGCPQDPNKTAAGDCGCGNPETPGCGVVGAVDSDLDGTPDDLDGCPNDALKIAPGSCGCGTPDSDTDGDGTPDCNDDCPADPAKVTPGSCGCGNPDADSDGNGTPDCNEVLAAGETTIREAFASAGSNFGWHVSVSGDRAIVGSPLLLNGGGQATGAARVLQRNPDGTWTPEAYLTAPDGRANDWFGGRVAIEGDVAAVGAPSAQRDVGAIYVFRRNGLGNWLFEQKLQPPEVANFSRLGSAVVVRGNTIVAGAPFDKTEGTAQRGSVVVFKWSSAGGWTLSQRLVANDGEHGDRFGNSVDMRDGLLVVGAPYDDTGAMTDHGSCYAFVPTIDNTGRWVLSAKIGSPNANIGNLFGRDIATDGLTLVCGSPNENGGAAYAFDFQPGIGLSEPLPLLAPDRDAADAFGSMVAIDAGTIVIGCRTDDVDGKQDAGSARLFRRNGVAWNHVGLLKPASVVAGDQYGWGVAISGSKVLVSAPGADAGGSDAGLVVAFDLTPLDCDEDGVPDVDSDDDGIADCIDTDDDDDGTPDATDGCPRDQFKTSPGSCGCGRPDSSDDWDGDGVPDCTDNCFAVPNPSQSDCNGDGVGDACDSVTDCNSNGVADICELDAGTLTDFNGNGTPDACEASTLRVPSTQFPTIQAALDAAPTGVASIVLVEPGTYIGSANTRGKPVRLHAVAGPQETIIDGSAVDGSLIVCNTNEGPLTVISGFTIRRGTRGTRIVPDQTWRAGGGIFIDRASPLIRDCVIENCRGEFGGGAYLLYSGAVLERCQFVGNTALEWGGAVQCLGGSTVLRDCSMIQNFCGIGGGGVHAVGGAIRLERCEILDNISLQRGGGVSWDSYTTSIPATNQPLQMIDCRVEFNFGQIDCGGARFWRYQPDPSNPKPEIAAIVSGSIFCGNVPMEICGPMLPDGATVVCLDCNRNGIPDVDDIVNSPSLDCNQNGLIDSCETRDGTTADRNANGIPDACESGTLFVPSEFGSIASAVTAALPGDTVWIEPGVYRESIDFGGKAITIRGVPGTVIDGSTATAPLLRAVTGEGPDSIVDGLTFRSGRAGSLVGNPAIFQVGAGAHVDSASPTFRNCVFEDCRTQYGAGAYMRRFRGLIENCTFRLNNALEDGGGLQFFEGAATVRNCLFEGNICSRNGGAVHVVMGSHRFEDCVFKGNRSFNGFGGGISWDGGIPSATQPLGPLVLVRCTFQDNRTPDVTPDKEMSEGGGLFVAPAWRNLPPAEISAGEFCKNTPQDIKGRWVEIEPVTFCPSACTSDLDANGLVDFGDVNLTLLDFGPCVACATDVNLDGAVDFGDVALLLLDFGPCQ